MRYSIIAAIEDEAFEHLANNRYSYYFEEVRTEFLRDEPIVELVEKRKDGICLYRRIRGTEEEEHSGDYNNSLFSDYYIIIPEHHPWFNVPYIEFRIRDAESHPRGMSQMLYIKLIDVMGREFVGDDTK